MPGLSVRVLGASRESKAVRGAGDFYIFMNYNLVMSSGVLDEISDGEYLRLRRRALGLTQAALAKLSGIPQPNISLIEQGKLNASPNLAQRLNAVITEKPGPILERNKGKLLKELNRFGLENVRVFGSVASGHDTVDSDVDLMATSARRLGISDKLEIEGAAERILATPVDLVVETPRNAGFLERARAQSVALS